MTRKVILMAALVFALAPWGRPGSPPVAKAGHNAMVPPWNAGESWWICAGYYSTATPTHQGFEGFSLDLVRRSSDISGHGCKLYGVTSQGEEVRAPTNGKVEWVDSPSATLCLNTRDTYSVKLGHFDVEPGVAQGSDVVEGQLLGKVLAPESRNKNVAHIHVGLYNNSSCKDASDSSRTVPLDNRMWGASLPNIGGSDQHQGEHVWYRFNFDLGDVNHDWVVDIRDLSILLSHWGAGVNDPADLNDDGVVDIFDLSIVLANFGHRYPDWGPWASPPSSQSMPSSRYSSDVSSTGPTIEVGTPALAAGEVHVPISVVGSVPDPYTAFNFHLRWNPALFSLGATSATGGLFEAGSTCPDYIPDSDGGGVSFACAFSDSHGTASTGLLADVVLVPQVPGCSRLQLMTFGPPDRGDGQTGTLTLSAANDAEQTNQVVAATTDTNGQPCTPPPCVNHDTDSMCDEIDQDDDGDGYDDNAEIAIGENPTVYCAIMRADVDNAGGVSTIDLSLIAAQFGQAIPPAWARFDQNSDNKVNLLDLSIVAARFFQKVGSCP